MYKIIAVLTISALTLKNVQAQDSLQSKAAKPVTKPAATKPAAVKNYGARPVQTGQPKATPGQTVSPMVQQQQPVTAPAPQNTDKSLNGQYQYILSKTYRYQQPPIVAFWKNVRDTLAVERRKLKDVSDKLAAQSKNTAALQNDLNQKTQSLDEVSSKQDEISLLGIGMPKATYNTVMWGAVGVMAVVLTIVILRTAGNRREAKYRTKLYEELSEEFQTYKVKANEKEKKLARELQTERNKVDELMGRG